MNGQAFVLTLENKLFLRQCLHYGLIKDFKKPVELNAGKMFFDLKAGSGVNDIKEFLIETWKLEGKDFKNWDYKERQKEERKVWKKLQNLCDYLVRLAWWNEFTARQLEAVDKIFVHKNGIDKKVSVYVLSNLKRLQKREMN